MPYDVNPRKPQPFARLRGDMRVYGLMNEDLARITGKSYNHISRCLNNHADWTLPDMYAILSAINRPAADLHIIFPQAGKDCEIQVVPIKISPSKQPRYKRSILL